MKDLSRYLCEEVGFDADEELELTYIDIFKHGSFDPIEDERLSDVDMWDSLGDFGQTHVLRTSQFTGAIDRSTCYPQITLKKTNMDLKELLEIIGDRVSNTFIRGKSDPDWDFYTIKYEGEEPVNIWEIDPQEPFTYQDYVFPRKNWRNMIKKEHIEWLIDEVGDNIWFKNQDALKSLAKYTGWEVYIKGKRIK